MPACQLCKVVKTRLDVNNICRPCRNVEKDTPLSLENEANELAIPELPEDWMLKPINELLGGHLVQVISRNLKPINDILNDHKKQLKVLNDDNKKLNDSIKALDKENKQLKQKLSLTGTKIVNSEKNQNIIIY